MNRIAAANAPSVEVFFAKQAPKTGIKPHTDFTNFIMTAHLGPDWRTLVLQDRCEWEPTNVGLFPKTTALVKGATGSHTTVAKLTIRPAW